MNGLHDVAIVGAGLAGIAAASVLDRIGYRVALIGAGTAPPHDFRAETFGDGQCEQLRRLGLFNDIVDAGTLVARVVCARHGRIIEQVEVEELNLTYPAMIAALQRQLPFSVTAIAERAIGLETGPQQQRVHLADGRQVEARLLLLATGPSERLPRLLGVERQMKHKAQCLTFGFDVAADGFDLPSLVYYGETLHDRVDYLRLFPIGNLLRANLFTYWSASQPQSRAMREDPGAALYRHLPGLRHVAPDLRPYGKVDVRVTDIYCAAPPRHDGVILIGDAFRMSSPAAGTGLTCLLTDLERLCSRYIPQWLEAPDVGADRLAEYYRDAPKVRSDEHAFDLADYRQKLTCATGLRWAVHRRRVWLMRGMRSFLRQHLGARWRRTAVAAHG